MSHTLRLFCLILTDDLGLSNPFPVDIAPTLTVGHLKKAIKEEKKNVLGSNDADQLILWKVSIPVDANLNDSLKNLDLTNKEPLNPVDELSEVFPNPLERKHLHIVAQLPHAGESCNLIPTYAACYWWSFVVHPNTNVPVSCP